MPAALTGFATGTLSGRLVWKCFLRHQPTLFSHTAFAFCGGCVALPSIKDVNPPTDGHFFPSLQHRSDAMTATLTPPDNFRTRARISTDDLGRWRRWYSHDGHWRITEFRSSLGRPKRYLVERRDNTPGGHCWEVVSRHYNLAKARQI
ncbi:MAG: hypothetical protein KDA52_14185, partial [Planctomycetaceae bacterium]|nr:hypothetical protein [Planctomycetaceae bacterium]